MWRKKTRVPAPDDLAEARRYRADAEAALQSAQAQDKSVRRLTTRIIERRDQNHFGDALQITFTPRGGTL